MVEFRIENILHLPYHLLSVELLLKGLIADLNQSETMSIDSQARKEIELAAMQKSWKQKSHLVEFLKMYQLRGAGV